MYKRCPERNTITESSLHLRKHAYSNIFENITTKNWKFLDTNSDTFHISAQNIDNGYPLELPRWGRCNEYPQSMFLSRNKKNNVYPCKPQLYYIKVGFKGSKLYSMFSWRQWHQNEAHKTDSMQNQKKKKRGGKNAVCSLFNNVITMFDRIQ